jgi:prepilin-type processing-associated H-X9-DG protein
VFLLPFIEQDALYRTIDVRTYMSSYGLNQSWRSVRGTSIPLMLCPTDSNNDKPFALNNGPWARGNYAANAGPGWLHQTLNGGSGTTSSAMTIGPGGLPLLGSFDGLPAGGLFGVNWGGTFDQVEDGTSNTILFNEVRAGLNQNDRRGVWAMGLAGCSVTAAHAIGDSPTPNDQTEYSDDIEDCTLARSTSGFYVQIAPPSMGLVKMGCSSDNRPRNFPNWQGQARSLHIGGVNACFADGSVHFIREDVVQIVWFCLNSRNDGRPVSPEGN